MSDWLKRIAKKEKQQRPGQQAAPGTRDNIEPIKVNIEDWHGIGNEEIDTLFVLAPPTMTKKRFCICFLSKGMENSMLRLPCNRVHLGVDTKMQVLDQGAGVATVSAGVKDGLRNTTLMRGADDPTHASRVQGRALSLVLSLKFLFTLAAKWAYSSPRIGVTWACRLSTNCRNAGCFEV
jgi:hypothetical protein